MTLHLKSNAPINTFNFCFTEICGITVHNWVFLFLNHQPHMMLHVWQFFLWQGRAEISNECNFCNRVLSGGASGLEPELWSSWLNLEKRVAGREWVTMIRKGAKKENKWRPLQTSHYQPHHPYFYLKLHPHFPCHWQVTCRTVATPSATITTTSTAPPSDRRVLLSLP